MEVDAELEAEAAPTVRAGAGARASADVEGRFSRALSLVIMGGHICVDTVQGGLAAILPFLVMYGGYSYFEVSTLVLASNFASAIIQPLFGWLGDRKARPWLMAAGVVLAGAGMAAIGVVPTYGMVVAAAVVSGVGVAMLHPEGGRIANLAGGADPVQKAQSMSLFSVGGQVGFCVGPIVTVAAVQAFGLAGTLVYLVFSLPYAAFMLRYNGRFAALGVGSPAGGAPVAGASSGAGDGAAVAGASARAATRAEGARPSGTLAATAGGSVQDAAGIQDDGGRKRVAAGGPSAQAAAPSASAPAPAASASAAPERWGAFSLVLGALSVRSIVYYGITSFAPLFVVGVLGQPENVGSSTITLFAFVGALATLAAGKVAAFVRTPVLMAGCFAVMAACFLAFAQVASLPLAMVLLVLLAVGVNLFNPPAITLGQDFVPAHLGMASGLSFGVAVCVGGCVSPALGALGDAAGLPAVMAALFALCLVGLALSLAVGAAKRRPAASSSSLLAEDGPGEQPA